MQQNTGNFLCKLIARKIHHFFFSFTLVLLFSVASAHAAGYTCETYQKYTSCNPGYYMSYNGSPNTEAQMDNACTKCEAGYYCPGGSATTGTNARLDCDNGSTTSSSNNYWTSAAGASARTQCYRTVTISKNGGSGPVSLTNAVTGETVSATGNTSLATQCYYNTACALPTITDVTTSDSHNVSNGLFSSYYTYCGGWSTATLVPSACPSTPTTSVKVTSTEASVTIYAAVTGDDRTITLDNNGATTAGTTTLYGRYVVGIYLDQAHTKSMTTTANPITLPTKTGYTFDGYAISTANCTSSTTRYISATGYRTSSYSEANTTTKFYACWIANTYTVSFNANNGSGGQSADVTATYGSNMPSISTTKPTRTGYTFGGWYDTSASSGGTQYYTAAGASARTWNKTSNTTLYARWTANTLTINYNTSSATSGSPSVTSQACSYDGTCTAATQGTMVKTNMVFRGWTKTSGGTTVDYAAGASIKNIISSGSITLYAVWATPTCSATKGTATLKNVTDNKPVCTITCSTGYSQNGGTNATKTFEVTGSAGATSASGTCKAITFTVAYTKDPSSATGTVPSSHTCTYDGTCTAATNPFSRTGYAFNKWSCTASSGSCAASTYASGGSLKNATSVAGATITLKSTWTANKFTVSFNGNSQTSGAPSVASVECTYDNACTAATMNTLAKTKRVFLGWSSSSTATSATYTSGGSIKNISTGAAVTLYAVWYEPTCSAGTGVNTTSLNSVSGNAPVCNRSSKDGYYCSATQTGTAGAKSLTVSCTPAGDGYYAKAGATSQTACAQGSYSAKSSASSTCTACPKGRTTSGTGTKYNATANTACSATCSNNAGVYEWATPSWSANTVANLCTVSKCNANTYYTAETGTGYKNTCTSCGSNSSTSAGNTSTTCTCTTGYTADGSVDGDPTSKSGCSLISDIECKSGEYVPAKATACSACTAGYYCPSSAKTYSYSSSIQGRTACSTIASGWTSLAGAAGISQCYYPITLNKNGFSGTLAAGAGTGCTVLSAASGTTNATLRLFYNTACTLPTFSGYTQTGYTAASSWSSASTIGASAVTTIAATTTTPTTTTYYARKTTCAANYYKSSTTACATCSSGTNSKYAYSVASANGLGACYLTTTAGNYVATAGAGETTCTEGYYCPGGSKIYYTTGVSSTTTGGQTACAGATYQNETGKTSCKSCPDGYTANTDSAKTAQSQCQISCAPGTQVATANAQCTTPSGNWFTTAEQLVNYGSTSTVNMCNVATNLFNPSEYDVFWGYIKSGTTITSYPTNAFVYIPVEPNTTYIVSGVGDATTTSGRVVYDMAATPAAGGTVLQRVLAGAKGKGMMITTGATAKYLGVMVLSDSDSASTSTRDAKVAANVANLQIFKASDGYGIIGNATTDHDAASDCQITCGAGQYVKTAGSACVNADAGYYATGGTVAQGGTSSQTPCGGNTKYSAAGASACTTVSTGYYTTGGTTTTRTGQSECTNGTYCEGGEQKTCPDGYGASEPGSDEAEDCYMSVAAKKHVKNAKDSTATACGTGTFKAAHTVYYGETSTCSSCPSGYDDGVAVATEGECVISVPGGKYVGTKKSATLSTCAGGKYKAQHTVAYGSTSSCATCSAGHFCPEGAGSETACSTLAGGFYPNSAAGSNEAADCYTNVLSGKYVASANATSATSCAAGKFKGAHIVNYGSTSSCGACALGSYSAAGASACTACQSGKTTSGTGKSSCDANCTNNNSYDGTWATATWSDNAVANLCQIATCAGGSKYASTNGAATGTLPSGYTQLAYLKSSGTQYIDTGVKAKQTTSIDIKAKPLSVSGGPSFFGSVINSVPNVFVGSSSSGDGSVFINDITNSTGYKIQAYKTYEIFVGGTTAVVKEAGGTAQEFTVSQPVASESSMYVFASNRGTAQRLGSFDYYYVKIYEAGTLVQNLIPAKRDSDGVLGMYDTVNNKFLVNAGSGTFVAGPAILKSQNTCTQCSDGTYSAGGNATSCTICPEGSYCQAGSSKAKRCPGDYVDGGPGAAKPTDCVIIAPAGTYIGSGGAPLQACAPGKFSLQHIVQLGQTSSCTPCAVGSYSAESGASLCTPCQGGKTTNGTGQTSCNANCENNNSYDSSWMTAVWQPSNAVSNLCSVASCSAGSSYSSYTYLDRTSEPIGYPRLNAVRAPRGAYVDTGIVPTINTAIRVRFQVTGSSTSQTAVMVGDRFGGNYVLGVNTSNDAVQTIGNLSITRTDYWRLGTQYDVFMSASAGQMVNNNLTHWSGGQPVAFTTTDTLKIFGDGVNSDRFMNDTLLFGLEIYESGTLVMNLVPVQGAQGSALLYDTVSGDFLDSASSYKLYPLQPTLNYLHNNICNPCAKGKYMSSNGHTKTSCSACDALEGVSEDGGTYTTASTGSTASTACMYTAPSKKIDGCDTVTTNTVTYSGSEWPETTYAVTADPGWIISGNNTAAATCSQCDGGTYSAGGTATSCGTIKASCYGGAGSSTECPNSCTENSFSVAGSDSISDCACDPGFSGNAATSGGTCTPCDKGTYKSAGGNTTCTSAGSGYYVDTTGATSRKACSALDSSKTDGTYSSVSPYDANTTCRFTQNDQPVPTHCATKTSNTMSYSGTAWPANTYKVTAAPGSIISGNNTAAAKCNQCDAGTYSAGGTATSCTSCAAGTYQPNTGKTSCIDASEGHYVSGTGKTAQTACTGATYQDETGQTSCKSCPSGYTANTGSAKTEATSCQISCAAGTQVATPNAQCTTPSGNWFTTVAQLVNYGSTSTVNMCNVATNLFNPSDYDVFWGYIKSGTTITSYANNAFVYIPVEPNTTYIVSGAGDATTTSGRSVFDMAAAPVAGNTVISRVSAGEKGKGMIITTGATAKYLGVFVLSDNDGASASTREAKVAANVANLQIFKASDGYGIIGNATTDHDAASDCQITCGAGQYVATAGSACVNAGAGYYATGGTVAQGSTSDRSECENWTYSSEGAASCSACLAVPDAVDGVAWTKASGTGWTSYSDCVVSQKPAHCASGSVKRTQSSESEWGDTTLVSTLKSNSGYYAGTLATACTICPEGSYCPASAKSATACPAGYGNSALGSSMDFHCYASCAPGTQVATPGAACTTPTGCWTSDEHNVYYGTTSASVNSGMWYASGVWENSSTDSSKHAGKSAVAQCVGNTDPGYQVSGYDYNTDRYTSMDHYGIRAVRMRYESVDRLNPNTGAVLSAGVMNVPLRLYEIDSLEGNGATNVFSGVVARYPANPTATSGSGSTSIATGVEVPDASAATDGIVLEDNTDYNKIGFMALEPGKYVVWQFNGLKLIRPIRFQVAPDDMGTPFRYNGLVIEVLFAADGQGEYWTPIYGPFDYIGTRGDIFDKVFTVGMTNVYVHPQQPCARGAVSPGYPYVPFDRNVVCATLGGSGGKYADECKIPSYYFSACSKATTCPAGSYCTGGLMNTCPVGYRDGTQEGVGELSGCLMKVPGGKYVATKNESSASGTCDAGYFSTERYVGYGSTDTCTACGGDKYQDETGQSVCKSCPSGYTANTDVAKTEQSQCQISCAAGTQVATPNAQCTTPSGNWFTTVAQLVNYGSTSTVNMCNVATNLFNPSDYNVFWGWFAEGYSLREHATKRNATVYIEVEPNTTYLISGSRAKGGMIVGSTAKVPNAGVAVSNVITLSSPNTNEGLVYTTSANAQYLVIMALRDADRATGDSVEENKPLLDANVANLQIFKASDGYGIIGNTTTDHDAASDCTITCGPGQYVATAGSACENVGAGYYATGGTVAQGGTSSRSQCTSPLTTIGYGTAANEAGDCGRKFHAGDNVIYLRSEKRGDTALNVKIGNQTFFGALSTTYSSPIKVKNGSTEYSVVNDWQ